MLILMQPCGVDEEVEARWSGSRTAPEMVEQAVPNGGQ
jgi:hypothetical protein